MTFLHSLQIKRALYLTSLQECGLISNSDPLALDHWVRITSSHLLGNMFCFPITKLCWEHCVCYLHLHVISTEVWPHGELDADKGRCWRIYTRLTIIKLCSWCYLQTSERAKSKNGTNSREGREQQACWWNLVTSAITGQTNWTCRQQWAWETHLNHTWWTKPFYNDVHVCRSSYYKAWSNRTKLALLPHPWLLLFWKNIITDSFLLLSFSYSSLIL